jgi:hypothetical protein
MRGRWRKGGIEIVRLKAVACKEPSGPSRTPSSPPPIPPLEPPPRSSSPASMRSCTAAVKSRWAASYASTWARGRGGEGQEEGCGSQHALPGARRAWRRMYGKEDAQATAQQEVGGGGQSRADTRAVAHNKVSAASRKPQRSTFNRPVQPPRPTAPPNRPPTASPPGPAPAEGAPRAAGPRAGASQPPRRPGLQGGEVRAKRCDLCE